MKILIVDDNTTNLKLLRAMLEAEGFPVVEAADGVEALAVLAREKIDAIISDILMPRMDGYRFCFEVRKSDRFGHLPFIFYTSTYNSPSDAKLALDLGGNRFIQKPASAEVILAALRELSAEPRPPTPTATLPEVELMKEYNVRLVAKLEEKNSGLAAQTEALIQSERQLRLQTTALETAANGVLISDRAGVILWVNPAFTVLTGYNAEDVIGKTPRVLKSGRHDRAFYRHFWQTILSGKTWRGEFINRRKDGAIRYDEHTVTPVRSESGEVTHFVGIMNDITERKLAEVALRESERKYRHLFESLSDAAFLVEADTGRIVETNDQAELLLGLARREIIGMNLNQFHQPGTPDQEHQRLISYTARATAANYETEIIRQDKRVVPVQVSSAPVTFHGTRLILALVRDTTERKQSETALRASEERFRQLAENVNEVFWMSNRDMTEILYLNPAYEKFWGRSCQSLYQQPLSFVDAIHPEDLAQFLAALERQKQGEEMDSEYRILRPDGAVRWIRDRCFQIRNEAGEFYRICRVAEDITARKWAELQSTAEHAVARVLAESESLARAAKKILQTICEQLRWAVGELWTVERGAKVLRCVEVWHPPSSEFKEFQENSRGMYLKHGEGLAGRVLAGGEPLWVPDLAGEITTPRARMAAQAGLRGAFAFPIRARDEILGVFEFFSSQIGRPDPAVIDLFHVIGRTIGMHIERTELENQLRQAQKMDAIGQLAGGVAHDFNNLLAIIQGHVHLMTMDGAACPQSDENLRHILGAADRAASLTRQLLMFSRRQEAYLGPMSLKETVDDTTKMLRRLIGAHIKVQVSHGTSLPMIQADAGMIDQVLMNLVINARDAMPTGGQLSIATDVVILDETHTRRNPEARAGRFVCLSVTDTGHGMSVEIMSRMFEPFFTTKAVGQGTGLGLATVYGIVRQHKGWVEVASEVDVGTTFKVFLPAAEAVSALGEAAVAGKQAAGGKETILLVEDESALRRAARRLLERYGYSVLEASSGVEALSVWELHGATVDLLLTDMIMPDGLTGRELARRLMGLKANLKVIYTSGYSLDLGGTSFRSREATMFLQKPYRPEKLLQAVRTVLDGH